MDVSNVKAGKKQVHAMTAEESKKRKEVCLTSIPTKLSELLQTGLLEGTAVTYRKRTKTGVDGEDLRGIICGNLIQCLCEDCKGKEDPRMTTSKFEKHAGSGSNRAADHMYVDNGNSLRKVLKACEAVKIPMLLAQTINQAIGKSQDESSPCSSTTTAKSCIEQVYGDHEQTNTEMTETMTETTERSSSIIQGDTKSTMNVSERRKSAWESLHDDTKLCYYNRGEEMRHGVKEGKFISCNCCKKLFSPTQFEGHAGFAGRRNPYKHIYTLDGKTLHDISLETKTDEYISTDTGVNEAGTSNNVFEKENCYERNIDAVEPAFEQNDRPLKYSDTLCCLCSRNHYRDGPFNLDTVLICDQCELEFHVRCLKKKPQRFPKGDWFCSRRCRGIHSIFQQTVEDGLKDLPEPMLNIIHQRQQQQQSVVGSGSDYDLNLKWCLLRGSTAATKEHREWLSLVVDLLHKNFGPMKAGKIDLIPPLVRGKATKNYNYSGMYCALLFHNSKVVSAVILRVFGKELAEIPVVATQIEFQKRGYCKALMGCVENVLASMRVEDVILHAMKSTVDFWKKLDFEDLDNIQLQNYKEYYPLSRFENSKMLHKPRSEIRQM